MWGCLLHHVFAGSANRSGDHEVQADHLLATQGSRRGSTHVGLHDTRTGGVQHKLKGPARVLAMQGLLLQGLDQCEAA